MGQPPPRLGLDSDSESDSDSYPDPDTDPDIDTDSEREGESEDESEGEYLRKRIEYHKSQGPAKSRRTAWSTSLVRRELGIWKDYCLKINKTKVDNDAFANEQLRTCEAGTIRTYLEWRVKSFRIKKESTIKSYWKRLSCGYIDLTGCRIDNGTELDIRDWIPTYLTPTYNLDTSEKEKLAMYVQDLYVIQHAHWADDTKALHGLSRVQISLLLLLSAATATRPGALVESSSAKGSNKALSFEHVTIMKVRDVKDPSRTTIIAKVNLVHIKNSGGKGRRKKFIFRLENTPALCIVMHFLGIAVAHGAFRRTFKSVEQIFNLEIPSERDVLYLKFKDRFATLPIFRDFEKTPEGIRVSESKACPYHKYRDHFVWLGRVAGFEDSLELYQIRRASGRNINTALSPEERNQTMGHHGNTYEEFYMPDLIERDFQSIYFGTPSQDDLIRSVARMGLSRDKRAPRTLTDEQKNDVYNDPNLAKLRQQRQRCKDKLYNQGYYPLSAAEGTHLYDRYKEKDRKISSMGNTLRHKRLSQVIRNFHDTIDELEIDRQIDGVALPEILTRSVTEYELREREAIVKLMSLSLNELGEEQALRARIKFVHKLSRLCHRQESRRFNPAKSIPTQVHGVKRTCGDVYDTESPKRSCHSALEPNNSACTQLSGNDIRSAKFKLEDVGTAQDLYPMIFTHSVCLICIGDEQASYMQRIHPFSRKDSMKRHLNKHVTQGVFEQRLQCKHPECSEWLEDVQHFKNHAARIHHVFY